MPKVLPIFYSKIKAKLLVLTCFKVWTVNEKYFFHLYLILEIKTRYAGHF